MNAEFADFDSMLAILAGDGGKSPGRFVCFAPFQDPNGEEAATFVGEEGTLADAFGILVRVVDELVAENEDRSVDAFREAMTEEAPTYAKAFAAIHSRPELLFAGAMLNFNAGTYDLSDTPEEAAADYYVGLLLQEFEGAKHVFVASAAPPHQDAAFAIMQIIQEGSGPLSSSERELAEAAATGDLNAIAHALKSGARVSAADERGMSALHHAVANRKGAAVTALLEAGADASLGDSSGNSPIFAAVERKLVGPYLKKLRGKGHIKIISDLIRAGASLDDTNLQGETLADIAPEVEESLEQIVEEE